MVRICACCFTPCNSISGLDWSYQTKRCNTCYKSKRRPTLNAVRFVTQIAKNGYFRQDVKYNGLLEVDPKWTVQYSDKLRSRSKLLKGMNLMRLTSLTPLKQKIKIKPKMRKR